jgi:hypothetical protein
MRLYYIIKIMCCSNRTTNALKTIKYFITMAKGHCGKKQLSDDWRDAATYSRARKQV